MDYTQSFLDLTKTLRPSREVLFYLMKPLKDFLRTGSQIRLRKKDALGFETQRFQQTVNDIPVEYGMMAVQTKNGKIVGQSGKWVVKVSKELDKSANLTENEALQSALSFVGAESYKWKNKEEEDFLKKKQEILMQALPLKES